MLEEKQKELKRQKDKLMTQTKDTLLRIAKEINISGRWDMSKDELVEAIILYTDKTKINYLINIKAGTLIAFNYQGSITSAKVLKASKSKLKILSKLIDGTVVEVKFYDVIWIKTGSRWPKEVYSEIRKVK